VLESDLSNELENSRIVRLLTKMSFINERAEFELDPRWSDSGDRYIIKLFRDYVFHSVNPDGRPILDLSHVMVCLNKVRDLVEARLILAKTWDTANL
jgi:PAB-dependent poly(A)-specific ribonuclease subunit 3